MNRLLVPAFVVCLAAAWAQPNAALRGTVTDPSGAAVPNALVQVRGPAGEKRARTGHTGQYEFPALPTGAYQVRITAKGFAAVLKKDFSIAAPATFDAQLAIESEAQVINVDDALGRVTGDPASNGGALIMRQRQIAQLSDDPDELALQLQALAGPAPGPNGGQMYIDGFSGGNLPPKSAIREIRINANPFSSEYDRPGFSRIEIFTKPGSESLHGQAFAQYNGQWLNSRNPLLTTPSRPPYRAQLYGMNLTGPLKRNKASFTLDAEHRRIGENAFIQATTLDTGLNPLRINQALAAPQSRTSMTPRLDYALSRSHTLVVRYQELRIGLDNQGAGDFNLASRSYDERQSEHTAQLTETSVLSPRAINETRFQYLRSTLRDAALDAAPSINVQDAFSSGGAPIGNSSTVTNSWELANTSTFTRAAHTLKWGGRVRQSFLADVSRNNFAGAFTFYTLEQYQRTLALQQAGYSAGEIAALGAGPSLFTRNAGVPEARVSQADAGLFANDDWRVRPNFTLSYGLRYEAQGNLGGLADFAPRIGIAWGLDAKGKRAAKTVLRAGLGTFYDRLPLVLTLNRLRYDGVAQQSFAIFNPDFFPNVPPTAALQAAGQPQQLRPVAAGIRSPRLYQSSVGIERQLDASSRLTLTWIESRGVHLLDARNVNAPLSGAYPYGDPSIRLLTESSGFSRQSQMVANVNVNRKKLFLFGYYALSYGRDDNEGVPADPYNLRAEWGPSAYADLRHRLAIGTTVPLPGKFSLSPFVAANSGAPYNITTGLDPSRTGIPAARPALLAAVAAPACRGGSLSYAPAFGCFDLNPAPGTPAVGHNFARGPAASNLVLRLARTWSFGHEGRSGVSDRGSGSQHGGAPPPAMFAAATGRRYNVTLSASTLNALNRANFAPPNGDLTSPYFGQYRALGGMIVMNHGGAPSTFNRKIDLQLRFTF